MGQCNYCAALRGRLEFLDGQVDIAVNRIIRHRKETNHEPREAADRELHDVRLDGQGGEGSKNGNS